jgi:hypothetical protein
LADGARRRHGLVELAQLALRQNLFAEVPLVNLSLKNDFVHALELGEGESPWEQFVANGRPLELVAQSPHRVVENPAMIKRQFREIKNSLPCSVGSIRGRDDFLLLVIDQGEVGDTDDASARVAVRITKGEELLEIDILDADLFFQLACCGVFEGFVGFDEAPGRAQQLRNGPCFRRISSTRKSFSAIVKITRSTVTDGRDAPLVLPFISFDNTVLFLKVS